MQFGTAFVHVKCVRCDQEIHAQPVMHDNQWYHAACYDEGRTPLQDGHTYTIEYEEDTP
jgi:hypothetical protein